MTDDFNTADEPDLGQDDDQPSDHPIHRLHRIRRRLDEIGSSLRRAIEEQDMAQLQIDFTEFNAELANMATVTASLNATISGEVQTAVDAANAAAATATQAAIASAVAAQLAADQAAAQEQTDAQVALLKTQLAAFTAAAQANGNTTGNTTAPVTSLSFSPTGLTASVGVPSVESVIITGGQEPYTATGLPTGATFDGTGNFSFDTTTVAGNSTVTIADSSPTPVTGELPIDIS